QFGLRIKQVDVTRPAFHEQEDDAFGLRFEMRLLRKERFEDGVRRAGRGLLFGEHRREGQAAKAVGCVAEELAGRTERVNRVRDLHGYQSTYTTSFKLNRA